ncbi:MAG: hypothetical protein H0X59_08235 [Chloroflexi bacterium]|nr:hypothetical protein [Chloroflexota bacterium]
MPLDFLKRRGDKSQASAEMAPALLPEDIEAEEHELKLTYRARTSQGVRMAAGPNALDELPNMLLGLARSAIEVVEPLELDFAEAAPVIQKSEQAMQWINANQERSPVARHALVVLESVDAVDPAFETVAVALLSGGIDTSGVRGDTDRTAQKILASLLANVLASQHAVGFTPSERPVPSGGSGGLICAHCGFASAHERAFYCPRCGMRMVRG